MNFEIQPSGPLALLFQQKSLELRHTIDLIRELDTEIKEIEAEIQSVMKTVRSSIITMITTIPGIGFRMGAMILAEIGDFSRFNSLDKIFTYSGQLSLNRIYSHMEKRRSRYLRYIMPKSLSVCGSCHLPLILQETI